MSDQHDTVVVKEGGSSTGVIVGIIALILVLGAGSTSQPTDVNVNVELPSVAPDAS